MIEFKATPPQWFENIILAFNDFDPNGTAFRYGGLMLNDEVFVDLNHLKVLMGWQTSAIQRIRQHRLKGA